VTGRPDGSLDDAVAAAARLLADARDVTLLAHVNPDADALGSALALGIALHRRGVKVRVAFASPERIPAAPEVLVSCDAAEPARLGALADRIGAAGATLMLDHHSSNPGFGDVQVLDPAAEATVVLAHRVLVALGAPLDPDVARCLYAGLVTDTRGFRTAGASAHLLAADLVTAGVDAEALVRPLMDAHPFAWFATLGRVLQGAVLEADGAGGLGLVHACVPLEITNRFRVEEVDSVVDVLRGAQEAEVAAVLKQAGPRRFVVSLRSTGRVDVAAVATRLGGGGHRAAAGCTLHGSVDEVLAALRAALHESSPR
jgi:phosphoesterase RecJ-like protein